MSKYFLSCNNPVTIKTRLGNTQVGCGKCVQCLQAKSDRLTLLLDLESQNHKYVEFITNTYNDECCPYIDVSSVSQYPIYTFLAKDMMYLPNEYRTRYQISGIPFISDVSAPPCFPIVFGNRKKRMFNPKTKQYYYVTDNSFANRYFTPTQGFTPLSVEEYNERVDNYYKLRSFSNSRGVPSRRNHIRILWYDDILRWHDRLRNFIRKNYETEIRYFTVGEYGSQSLRPHWHTLLFHDSEELHRAFLDVVDLPGHTEKRPRQVCRQLYLSKIWSFGDTTSKTTDKHIGNYLSGYLNQHSSFPSVLEEFPQRCFHSCFLGLDAKDKSSKTLFKDGDFEKLLTTSVVNRKGIERGVSVPDSLYRQFTVRFTSSSFRPLEDNYALLAAANCFLEKTDINIFSESDLHSVFLFLRAFSPQDKTYFSKALLKLQSFVDEVVTPNYYDKSTLNPLKSIFYASRKLYQMSHFMEMTPIQYLRQLDKLTHYVDYQRLKEQFTLLELDPNYAYQYYTSFSNFDVCPDFAKVKRTPLFQRQQTEANIAYTSNIKHRAVVDLYINSKMENYD